MKEFLKIAVYFFLFALCLIFAGLHYKFKTDFFLGLSAYAFIAMCLFAIIEFLPKLVESFRAVKDLIHKQTSKEPREDNTRTMENYWFEFFEKNPIATILFNQDSEILFKNNQFLLLENKFLKGKIVRLDQAINIDEITNGGRFSVNYPQVKEIRLKGNESVQFSFIFLPLENKPGEKYFLAHFIDSSEKSELKEKFFQAQKMQAIGQLAGGVAHDFNNLLTAIIGFCDLLLQRHQPGEQSFVDIVQIKQNANRAANLIRQLLAFSRKQTMLMEELDLNEVLGEISNLVRRLIGENISLRFTHERDIWNVKADKSQLEQVIVNLAVNARDAMNNGGTLSISTKNIEIISVRDLKFKYKNYSGSQSIEAGEYVLLKVEDSGCGISPQNLEKIFEPFYTTKGVGQGTGLGLSTVTGIVEQTGGYLFVSSEQKFGTEFYILLKKYSTKDKVIEQVKVEEVKPKDLTGTGTVLIVEDEEAVRMFSARALKNKGYNVLEAYNGENALEIIEHEQGRIDLIVSDVVMPGISGPEMAEKAIKQYPMIKVIFVSGYGEDVFYEKYGEDRKFNFLPKPYTLNDLASRVKDLLK